MIQNYLQYFSSIYIIYFLINLYECKLAKLIQSIPYASHQYPLKAISSQYVSHKPIKNWRSKPIKALYFTKISFSEKNNFYSFSPFITVLVGRITGFQGGISLFSQQSNSGFSAQLVHEQGNDIHGKFDFFSPFSPLYLKQFYKIPRSVDDVIIFCKYCKQNLLYYLLQLLKLNYLYHKNKLFYAANIFIGY